MPDAVERRHAAIKGVSDAFLDPDNGYNVKAATTRASVAARIDELRPLGRTDRWCGALDTWRTWVLDTETDLRWAIVQGSIGANHAAS